jgi:polysaccharide pyruvyl transferase WcaK-like protein
VRTYLSIDNETLDHPLLSEKYVTRPGNGRRKIGFFGHFGLDNFGNEATLLAVLQNLRRYVPDADVLCICTGPSSTSESHNICAVPIDNVHFKATWLQGNRWLRFLRKIIIGIPSEAYRWIRAFRTLKNTKALIVPGTGLLTDAFGRVSWGPYALFKWSLIARMRGTNLLFVSVGAGPLYARSSRWLVRAALSLAHFRSYRDPETLEYLRGLGLGTGRDYVYPDLAFSIPKTRACACDDGPPRKRRVVGIGLMQYGGRLSAEHPSDATQIAYLGVLAEFVKWLLGGDYDIRLLIGDVCDRPVTRAFKRLLMDRSTWDGERIIDEEVSSVQELLFQIAATDVVVATRFHNVLFALLLSKPVVSISFHQKCTSLMTQMGLSEYCQDIHQLEIGKLIAQFCSLEQNATVVRASIERKAEECRRALDDQYRVIFGEMLGSGERAGASSGISI